MSRGFVVAVLVAFVVPVLAAVGYLARSDSTAHPATSVVAKAPAKKAAPVVKLSGTTSQDRSFGLRVSADGRRIVRVSVSYQASCMDGGMKMALDDTLYTPIKVANDGSFTVANLGQRLSLTGRIVDGKATGTFRIKMLYGGLLACKTAPIRFTARA